MAERMGLLLLQLVEEFLSLVLVAVALPPSRLLHESPALGQPQPALVLRFKNSMCPTLLLDV